jgi:hypothetical protein
MYASIFSMRENVKDHTQKNKSFKECGKENFNDTDLCNIVKKMNKINDQLLAFQFTKNMISPITFTNPEVSTLCP